MSSGHAEGAPRRSEKLRIGVISLGCAKNLVDTEVMLGHLDRAGCAFVTDPQQADLILVNTCGFIEPAREESIRTILEAAELKKTGRLKRLVVAGCMVQRHEAELRAQLPEVDAFVGLDELERIVASCGLAPAPPAPPSPRRGGDALPLLPATPAAHRPAPAAVAAWSPATYLYDDETPRLISTPRWSAFVKIAEGCDHSCAFCSIPTFRGAFRSRSAESIRRETESLAASGVREINLIAQDSSHYGRDRDRPEALADLLQALNEVRDLRWIRVHYLYPNTVTERLIETMARLPRVVSYVDLPLQHAAESTLRRMRRGGSAGRHLELLERFRRAMPDVALRTTFLVGFPGETDKEFRDLLDFLLEARFDHVGVFAYSHEEGTPAFGGEDDVPAAIKAERRERVLQAQQSVVQANNRGRLGRTEEVLVEGAHAETEHLLVGRTRGQAPEVDSQVLINDGVAAPGEFVRVEFTDTAGYDLVGRIVGPSPAPGED